ncbi:MAG: sigma-54-dependent transcriptional regulator [Terriglobales bacterium]
MPAEHPAPSTASAPTGPAAGPVARILLADDQPAILESLRLLLKPEGYATQTATSPAGVLAAIEAHDFDAMVMDLNYARDTTTGAEGLDLLAHIQRLDAHLPVVVMTAWGSVDLAVAALRRGARDFVQKPWDNARLLSILRTQIELGRAMRRQQRLEAENQFLRTEGVPPMIAESRPMRSVLELLARVGPSGANVLITGEHGTGKELAARALHALSPRAAKPWVAVNVGGLPEGVFESELFGHVRGAFTDAKADRLGRFEMADAGTLFLDEVGNLPLAQQAKLLRAVQTGEIERVGSSRTRRVDVRIVSATNADLAPAAASGQFRPDLLFRLNTVEIHVPPLRERREDIPLLAGHFLAHFAAHYRKPFTAEAGFDPAAMRLMLEYTWPGNVRELEHAVERAVLLATGARIVAADLGLSRHPPLKAESGQRLEEMTLEEVERVLIQKTMERCAGNISQAAKALGLSRSGLYRRLERHRL